MAVGLHQDVRTETRLRQENEELLQEVRWLRAQAAAPGCTFNGRVTKGTFKPQKEGGLTAEIVVTIPNVHHDSVALLVLTELMAEEESGVKIGLTQLVEQQRLEGMSGREEEPQAADQTRFDDAPPQDDVETGAQDSAPEDSGADVRPPSEFTLEDSDYQGTGLPLYRLEANIDQAQLAEAAYQATIPPCAINLVRTTERDGGSMQSATLYHYLGPGNDPVIRRITGPIRERWIEELRDARHIEREP